MYECYWCTTKEEFVMTELNTQIKCPNCGEEYDPVPDLPEWTYTEICPKCLEPITYTIVNGEVRMVIDPPTVSQSWKGAGEPGGKNG